MATGHQADHWSLRKSQESYNCNITTDCSHAQVLIGLLFILQTKGSIKSCVNLISWQVTCGYLTCWSWAIFYSLEAGPGVFFSSFLSSDCWVITGCMCKSSSAKCPALLGQALFRQLQELFQLWLHLDDLNRKTTDRFIICSSNMAGSNESLQNIHLQFIFDKFIPYSMKEWFNMMLRDGSYRWWEEWMFVFKIEFQHCFVIVASHNA